MRSSIEREAILEETSMSCLMVMRGPVLAGGEELTVMWKVRAAPGQQRYVAYLFLYNIMVDLMLTWTKTIEVEERGKFS